MKLRVFLVVAIVAGLGAGLLSEFLLRPQIRQLIQQREDNARERDRQTNLRLKVEANLKAAQTEHENALKQAAEADQHRASALAERDRERQNAVQFAKNLPPTRPDSKQSGLWQSGRLSPWSRSRWP
jgi:hypothetical protein